MSERLTELVGQNLQNLARAWGASEIRYLGGRRYVATRPDGAELRMLADEGDGAIEGEDGFGEAWEADEAE
jgi:hypothetical protein